MTIHQLNRLVNLNKDADSGFRTAAANVNNSEIQTLFIKYADTHAKFAAELQAEIDHLGADPSDSGTVGGAVHRGWLDVKAALTGHSVKAMLTACQSAEQSIESSYLEFIHLNHHGQIHTLLHKHSEQIKGFSKHLERLIGEIKDGVEFQTNA
jgi:uncharacterized protein (TIGR02284 family)